MVDNHGAGDNNAMILTYLVEVMRTKYGPVPGKIVKVVHYDGDKEVENEEWADDEETDEVKVSEIASTAIRVLGVFWHGVTHSTRSVSRHKGKDLGDK